MQPSTCFTSGMFKLIALRHSHLTSLTSKFKVKAGGAQDMSQDAIFLFHALSWERKAGTFQEQATGKVCLRRNIHSPFHQVTQGKALQISTRTSLGLAF